MSELEPGVPRGFVGQLLRDTDEVADDSVDSFANRVTRALEKQSISTDAILSIPRRAADSLEPHEFMETYAAKGQPVVLTDSADGWDPGVWSNPELLAEAYGEDTPWTIRQGHSYEEMKSIETSLPRYLADARAGLGQSLAAAQRPSYGANNYVPPWLLPHLSLPKFYPAHNFRMLDTAMWIGAPGSGVHLHRDIQDNFSQQLFGQKEWALVAPHESSSLSTTVVTPFLHTTAVRLGQDPPSQVRTLRTTLGAGDLLYVPAGWFHSTNAVGDEISGAVNFFASACFGSLRVIMPDFPHLRTESWPPGLEPGTWAL